MKKNQRGFTIVEILLVVVVVGLLGTIGWLVYDKLNSKPSDTGQTVKQEKKTAPPKAEPTPGPAIFKTFEISYGSEWKITEQRSEDASCGDGKTSEKLELTKDQKSINIAVNDCGKDFPSDAMIDFGISGNKVTIPNKKIVLCDNTADEGGFCTSGDGELLVGGSVGEYDETKNNYFIYFHNAASEDASVGTLSDVYEVIESIKLSQ